MRKRKYVEHKGTNADGTFNYFYTLTKRKKGKPMKGWF
jgi:hypothetical protein